ncbi:hypothetical protein GQ457_10G000040 [Hibiscus cannabinus]
MEKFIENLKLRALEEATNLFKKALLFEWNEDSEKKVLVILFLTCMSYKEDRKVIDARRRAARKVMSRKKVLSNHFAELTTNAESQVVKKNFLESGQLPVTSVKITVI